MNDATLLIIEGKHAEYPGFGLELRKKGFTTEMVSSGSEAIKRITDGFSPDVVIVNAATLRTSGKRICQSLHVQEGKLPILLILDPDREADAIEADVVLTLPFTVQKLLTAFATYYPEKARIACMPG